MRAATNADRHTHLCASPCDPTPAHDGAGLRCRPLRIVIDGLPVRSSSLSVVLENLLRGWDQLGITDELHVVIGMDVEVAVPSRFCVHRVALGTSLLQRVYGGGLSTFVPRLCQRVNADVLLATLPSTTVRALPCPRVLVVYDLRYEIRHRAVLDTGRFLRRFSYNLGYRQADGIACISERTRRDLLRVHPELAATPVRALPGRRPRGDLAAPAPAPGPACARSLAPALGRGYALAFGQFANKNVDLVIDAWTVLCERGDALPLMLVGLPEGNARRW